MSDALARLLARDTTLGASTLRVDPEYPQKGQWGGRASARGRTLSATVREVSPGWFEVSITLNCTSGALLDHPVFFHAPDIQSIRPKAHARQWRGDDFSVGVGARLPKALMRTTVQRSLSWTGLPIRAMPSYSEVEDDQISSGC